LWRVTRFIFPAHLLGMLATSLQVGLDFAAVAEVVTDYRVDVGQVKRGEAMYDLFGCRAILILAHHRVQRNAGCPDQYYAVFVRC
jgi:hypothetical protein